MSITFIANIINGELKAEDGVTELTRIGINNLENIKFGFDH